MSKEKVKDTSGFYRLDNGELQYKQYKVDGPDYALYSDFKHLYTYPTYGNWGWFNSEDEAKDTLYKGVEDASS